MVKKLIEIITYKWKAKIGSLILAILFHYYVIYTKTVSKTFYISIEPLSIPNNLVFSEEPPSFMKVVFTGPEEIMDINQSNFKIRLINPSPTAGVNSYRVELIPSPPPGIIAFPQKNEVEIILDKKKIKLLPIVPLFDLPFNKFVTYWEIKPSEIYIEGPQKLFSNFDRIHLTKIDLKNKNNLFFDKVLIDNLPKFVRVVENQPIEIQVLLKFFSHEEFEDKIKNLSPDLKVFTEELEVNCSNINIIDNIELDKIPKVSLIYISKVKLPKLAFNAMVYCPVEFNNNTKTIEPNAFIPDVPIQIKINEFFKDVEIIKIDPLTADLNFRQKIIRQIEKGLQEHLKLN